MRHIKSRKASIRVPNSKKKVYAAIFEPNIIYWLHNGIK